jgi:hypothetical protein
MMADEYGGDAPVCCPICEATADDGCDHVLACIDQTFDECEGGTVLHGWWDESRARLEETFKAYFLSGHKPAWDCSYVTEAWNAMLAERRNTGEDVFLHAFTATDLLLYVLEESGGTEVGLGLIGGSGGHCASEYRLLYAEDPEAVCAKATTTLEQCLRERSRSG